MMKKCYSDAELNRLHSGYHYLDKQTARLLIIHELLGLRISDTLTIRKSDLIFGEHPRLFISQQKTGKPFEKKLNSEILSLLSASIHETFSKYGDCEYMTRMKTETSLSMKKKQKQCALSFLCICMVFLQNRLQRK